MAASTATASQGGGLPLPPHLNNNRSTILAPLLYGAIVGSILVGIILVQASIYFVRYPKDKLYIKVIVTLLTIVSLITWSASLDLLNHAFIAGYGSVIAMHAWPRTVFVCLSSPAFSATLSQAWYASRVYRLSGNKKWIAGVLSACILASFVVGMVALGLEPNGQPVPINGSDLAIFEPFVPDVKARFWRVNNAIQGFLWVSAATDVVITGFLVYLLTADRRKAPDHSTSKLLSRVLVLSVTTGGLQALFSVAEALIVLPTASSNNVNLGMTLSLTHVYSLVCISSLNVRRSINPARKGSQSTSDSSFPRPSLGTVMGSEKYEIMSHAISPKSSLSSMSTFRPARPSPPKMTASDLAELNTDRFDGASSLESQRRSPFDGRQSPMPVMPRLSYLLQPPAAKQRDRGKFNFPNRSPT